MHHETWQVEVQGRIYETDFAGLTQWIAESSLLPTDKIRRGNLSWIEAKQVPALNPYFAGRPPMAATGSVSNGQNFNAAAPQNHQANTAVNFAMPENFGVTVSNNSAGFASPHITAPVLESDPDDLLEIFAAPQAAAIVQTEAPVSAQMDALEIFAPEAANLPESNLFENDALEIFAPAPQTAAPAAFETFAPEPQALVYKLEPAPTFPAPEELPGPEPSVQVVPPPPPASEPAGPAASAGKSSLNCALHPEAEAAFACRQCLSLFCAECPRTISKVKLCPRCGDMCQPYGAGQTVKTTLSAKTAKQTYVDPDFTFNDFLEAWQYPLKSPAALLLGALIMTALGYGVYLGTVSMAFGAVFAGGMAAVFCGVLSVAFLFGCTFNAVKQVAYGKKEETFMPGGEDFSLWESVLRPALLGFGAFAIALGPAVILVVMLVRTMPPVPDELQKQMQNVNAPAQKQGVPTAPNDGTISPAEWQAMLEKNTKEQQADSAKKIEDLIRTTQTNETAKLEQPILSREQMIDSYMNRLAGRIVPFVLAMCVALLWALFYFPVALTVGGFTQSIGATLNPLVGLETVKLMGGNYLKAFGTYLLLMLAGVFIFFGVAIVTIPFALFGVGGVAGQLLGNLASLYLYLVTACIFGTALYRSHEKLGYSVN